MTLTMPPAPSGSPQQMAMAQYAYLFQMAQQLNLALGQLESGGTGAASGGGTSTHQGTGRRESTGYQELKSLIVKTARLVKRQMEQLSARLEGEYVAVSDFGTYVERLSAYLEANPEALTQYYSFCSDLQDTEGYIRTGIVGYNGSIPIYGVAVGQGLTVTDVDGETVVDQNNFRATFTAQRLSFWQDANEVAYVSNNRLYITNITVLEGVTLGQWQITTASGLAFRWIGG